MTQAPITHVVQAYCTGEGWMDARTASSIKEARELEKALLADPNAWLAAHKPPHNHPQGTRIVPVNQSNCADRYLHPERYGHVKQA
jgi:hypothetical protein